MPIEAGGEVFGVVNMNFPPQTPPTEDEQASLEVLAAHAAVAIRNARLALHEAQALHDSRARQAQLEALLGITRELSALHSVESLLALIASTCGRLLDSGSVGFRLLEGDELVMTGTWGDASEIMTVSGLKIGESVSGIVAATGDPLVITDIANDPRVIPAHRSTRARGGYRHWLGVPVKIGGRLVGVLSIWTRRDPGFSEHDVAIATTFAAQAAIALETARLYTDAERRRQTAERLADVGRLITQSLDVQEVAQRVVDALRSLIPALRAALYRIDLLSDDLLLVADSNDPTITIPSHIVVRHGTGLAGLACRERRLVVSPNILTDARFRLDADLQAYWASTSIRAGVAVPLIGSASILGVLIVADREGRTFTDEEQRVLEVFAAQATVALDNARLYAEAKQAYEALSHAQTQLLRVETLRAVGELASGASHHLNNLLAVVLGRLQLALVKFDDPDLRKQLVPAERAARDGAEVVARLMRFSRRQTPPTLVGVDLNALAEEVIELTRPRWQDDLVAKGLTVDVSLERGAIPEIAGDPPSLREVLVNLVLNAVDAMPNGGRMTLATWAAEGSVYCRVSDTGIGMSPDVQQRAFEPFFTTKGVKSTGLGLSVSYGILSGMAAS